MSLHFSKKLIFDLDKKTKVRSFEIVQYNDKKFKKGA